MRFSTGRVVHALAQHAVDSGRRVRIVLSDALSSFLKNNGLSASSSLAFSATLAMIPALFLLTFLLGSLIGSSAKALAKTQDMLQELLPAYSQTILGEVRFISARIGTLGIVNALVLFLSMTPLAADLRIALGAVYRKKSLHPFLRTKLYDVAVSMVFLLGLAAIAVAGFVFSAFEKKSNLRVPLGPLGGAAPFLFMCAVVFWLYAVFSHRVRPRHLFAGAMATAVVWFSIRPAFHLFLLYNPGYGFAFGSLKSFFVVIIWIYVSFVIFLFGAEISASLGRDETAYIKHLVEGGRNVPSGIRDKYVLSAKAGTLLFQEGDPGIAMYAVLKGQVGIRKGGKEIGIVTEGKCFGGISFLLSTPRAADAVALTDVELTGIDNENVNKLMNEYPELVVEMLRDMAARLRDASVSD
jgi:membrane protein